MKSKTQIVKWTGAITIFYPIPAFFLAAVNFLLQDFQMAILLFLSAIISLIITWGIIAFETIKAKENPQIETTNWIVWKGRLRPPGIIPNKT